ncbi:MAG: hypothetical protein IJ859_11840 [Synergistaceae bacterium]|nr:hypothetical protein [Synergistaceae bacterium]
MESVITRKGNEVFINLETLEEIKNDLFELPEKQRSLLKIKEAVAYLLPSILNAKDKNYSEAEILEHFTRAGLKFNKSSAMYFWRIFNSMTQGKRRKKQSKDDKKIFTECSDSDSEYDLESIEHSINTDVLTNAIKNMNTTDSEVSVSNIYEELRKSLPTVDENNEATKDNEISHSSAYFEVKPDTEDL